MLQRIQTSTDQTANSSIVPSIQKIASHLDTGVLFVARFVAFIVSLILWFVLVLPIWLMMVARTMVAFGVINVLSAFSGRGPADPSRFETVVRLWPTGLVTLAGVLTGRSGPQPSPLIDDWLRLLRETLLLVLLIAGLMAAPYVMSAINRGVSTLASQVPWPTATSFTRPAWQR